ncbi:hypothetical protein V8V91_08665 [Algoriphagus halophilus]|uniref:hypothetical protein n=1 Tax=Algoriphagus halophilus TaxID=226505 RepID=UPI00358FF044
MSKPTIKLTISGPQGSGKTNLLNKIRVVFEENLFYKLLEIDEEGPGEDETLTLADEFHEVIVEVKEVGSEQ